MFNLNIIKLHDLVLEAAETERRMPEPGKLAKIKTYCPAWAKLSRIMKIDRRVIKKRYQDSLIMLLYLIKRQP